MTRERKQEDMKFKKNSDLNPLPLKSDLLDFALSKARQFYSSKGDPFGG